MDVTEYNRFLTHPQAGRHPWEIVRVKIILFLIRKHVAPFMHLADVGSGDNFVLRNLAKVFPSATYSAIDTAYDPATVSRLQEENKGVTLQFYNSLKELPIDSPGADCVLLLDVLEHCQDDNKFLGEVLEKASQRSRVSILITVPAFQVLYSGHDQLLSHYRRYSVKSISDLCKKNKLNVISSGYFFFSLLPVRLFQLVLEKIKKRRPEHSIDNWNGAAFISKIISAILWTDFRLLYALRKIKINLPGLSCFCICQQSPS